MNKYELIKLVKSGKTDKEISEHFKCGRTKVQSYLRSFGIKRTGAHPDLNKSYFSKIDSKDKAYWLGFLFADGYVNKNSINIQLSYKDVVLLYNFCECIGANKRKVVIYERNGKKYCRLSVSSVEISKDLFNIGCVNNKTFTIKYPEFKNKELDLSFMMGYYDGDGSQDNCLVCCASLCFLETMKDRYKISSEIRKNGSAYVLYIGAKLKREMMEMYPNSLPRKRKTYKGDKGFKTRKEKYNNNKKRKFEISKSKLEGLLKEGTYVSVGKMFGVSDNAIRKRAKLLGIIK